MTQQDFHPVEAKANYRVPFGTVSITDKARQLIQGAFDSNWVTKGKYVKEFEEKFAHIFGRREAIAVSSGTDANAIACAVLYDFGAKRGDEIITPALSFVGTGNAIIQAGFKPVFVDIRLETLNIDVNKIEEVITDKTRAVMPVHLMGKPAQMDKILDVAKRFKLHVIEDAAEAHGAKFHDQLVGTFGNMAAFSLYAAHIITTIEGGIIITDDLKMAEVARSLRNHGMINKFDFERIGFSAKMNEIEAAVGLGNIEIFEKILMKRRENYSYLIDQFKRFDDFFITLKEENYEKIGPHAFSIIVRENAGFTKNQLVHYLDVAGVDSRNLFNSMPTQTPGYSYLGYNLGDFPEAEYCSQHGFHIGIHQDLGRDELEYVVSVIDQFFKSNGITC